MLIYPVMNVSLLVNANTKISRPLSVLLKTLLIIPTIQPNVKRFMIPPNSSPRFMESRELPEKIDSIQNFIKLTNKTNICSNPLLRVFYCYPRYLKPKISFGLRIFPIPSSAIQKMSVPWSIQITMKVFKFFDIRNKNSNHSNPFCIMQFFPRKYFSKSTISQIYKLPTRKSCSPMKKRSSNSLVLLFF